MHWQFEPEIRPTPVSVADAGKVRLGGESPSFGPVRSAPAITADNGKVRAARARALARSALRKRSPHSARFLGDGGRT
jgi:hypothetical protein